MNRRIAWPGQIQRVTEAAPLPSAAAAPQFPLLPSQQSSPASPSWPYAASGASPRPPLRKRPPGSAWGRTVSSSAFPAEPSSWPPATLTGRAGTEPGGLSRKQKPGLEFGAELHSMVPSKIAMCLLGEGEEERPPIPIGGLLPASFLFPFRQRSPPWPSGQQPRRGRASPREGEPGPLLLTPFCSVRAASGQGYPGSPSRQAAKSLGTKAELREASTMMAI